MFQVCAIITDNAPNMLAAMRSTGWTGIGCTAHSLQIAVRKAMQASNTNNVLAKARKIVGHVKHSAANLRELKEVMKQHGEPEESLVSEDCVEL